MGGFLAQILGIAPCGARTQALRIIFDQTGVPFVIKKVYAFRAVANAITQKVYSVVAPTVTNESSLNLGKVTW